MITVYLVLEVILENMLNNNILCFYRSFLDQVKEASGRFLYEKREAQDAINLL